MNIKAGVIKDSRREKTVFVKINKVWSASPSGKSTGKYEKNAFSPRGVESSVSFINKISKKIQNIKLKEFNDLKKVEKIIKKYDKNFSKIGANGLFALESALLKNAAKERSEELFKFLSSKKHKIPYPIANVIGGGKHSNEKFKPDFQEFEIISLKNNIQENIQQNKEIYWKLRKELKKRDPTFKSRKTDEHAWVSTLTNEHIFEIIKNVSKDFKKVKLGTDIAASSFFQDKKYSYKNRKLTRDEQVEYIDNLIKKYSLFYIEDPVEENDFNSFQQLLKKNKKSLICGDDLTTTNPKRLKRALKKLNCVIVKPNQIGSLIQTKNFIDLAKKHNIKTVISHRSGETLDPAITHLGVAWGCDFIKTGVIGKEREVKLKELVKISKA